MNDKENDMLNDRIADRHLTIFIYCITLLPLIVAALIDIAGYIF